MIILLKVFLTNIKNFHNVTDTQIETIYLISYNDNFITLHKCLL